MVCSVCTINIWGKVFNANRPIWWNDLSDDLDFSEHSHKQDYSTIPLEMSHSYRSIISPLISSLHQDPHPQRELWSREFGCSFYSWVFFDAKPPWFYKRCGGQCWSVFILCPPSPRADVLPIPNLLWWEPSREIFRARLKEWREETGR